MKVDKPFDLENQYQLFLHRCALTEADMHPEQKLQLRQAFMAGCGQMLFLLRDEVAPLPVGIGLATMKDLSSQIQDFWINEIARLRKGGKL